MGGQLCQLSANLEEAIRRLRHDEEDVFFWCDQLCINQHDDTEKSYQVQRMKDIYSDALKVVAWIGASTNDSDLCITYLKALGQDEVLDSNADYSRVLVDYDDESTVTKLTTAFDHFCQRSYWKRLWIIQVFALAKEVQIACGASSIPYYELSEALYVIPKIKNWLMAQSGLGTEFERRSKSFCRAFDPPNSDSFVHSVLICRYRYNEPNERGRLSLFGVMHTCLTLEVDYNHPECSDSRDRVFSLLGLVNDAETFSMFPDYSKTGEEVYEELTIQFIRQGIVDVLAYCQFPRVPRNREMATWAPDWHMPTKQPCIPVLNSNGFTASGETSNRQLVLLPGSGRLSILGIDVDVIDTVGSLWDPDWLSPLEPRETMKYLSEITGFCLKSNRMTHNEVVGVANEVARIAIADRLFATDESKQHTCLMYHQKFVKSLAGIINQPPLSSEEEKLQRMKIITTNPEYATTLRRIHSRRPILTQSGYVCLAPQHARAGDQICIFFGGRAAYVIRPIGSDEYNLIGEVYVHGAMYGECMKSTLQEKRYILR
jgi:hypothetical protein